MFMAITCVLAALPDIAADLRADGRELQWIADVYPLALATLLLPSGVLADRFGRRTFLCLGLAVLVVGLVGASQARTPTLLLASLAVAGIGSGIGFPSTLATITGAVSADRRPLAISLWAASVPVGGISGAILTGAVLDAWSWPWGFGATATVAAAALVLALVAVPETRDPERRRLDVVGTVLSAAAVALLVVGLTQGPVEGWTAPGTIGWLLAALIAMALFVGQELRATSPLLDVRLFALPAFGSAVAAMFLLFGGLFALVYLGYQWQTYVLGYGTLRAGLGLGPLGLLMLPLAVTSPRIAARLGLKATIALALLSGVAGALILVWAGHTEQYWTFGLGCVVFGVSIGLSAGPGTDAISRPLPASRQGVASAVNDLARELGSTLGIAVSGSAFTAAYRHHVEARLPAGDDPLSAAIRASPGAGLEAMAAGPGGGDPAAMRLLTAGVSAGWSTAALVVAGAFVVGLVLFLARFPGGRDGRQPR